MTRIYHIGEKRPEWEFEEISGGRWALKRHGLVVKVAYSADELQKWLGITHGIRITEDPGKALKRAVERL